LAQQQRDRLSHTVSPVGFGAFKIGRNEKTKYPQSYDLPSEQAVAELLNALLDMGMNYIDTAPAYGISEERIGAAVSHRRSEFVLSSKIGETFEDGQSHYEFSRDAAHRSVERSLKRLRADSLDILFIHSDGSDIHILEETDTVEGLHEMKELGLAKEIGLSGKTTEGMFKSLDWADSIMVEYHINDESMSEVIDEAERRGISVMVKKGLSSGHLNASSAIRFCLEKSGVKSVVIGSLKAEHMRTNLETALKVRIDSV
jgi:aryl-alcohol dehydrogenase-like predicted oxidoreductase